MRSGTCSERRGPGCLPFNDATFDSVSVRFGYMFFPDLAKAVVAPPAPDGPNMFRSAAPGYVSALYQDAGLHDIAEWDIDVELVTPSPEQYWEMISEHVSLAIAALQQVGEPGRAGKIAV